MIKYSWIKAVVFKCGVNLVDDFRVVVLNSSSSVVSSLVVNSILTLYIFSLASH